MQLLCNSNSKDVTTVLHSDLQEAMKDSIEPVIVLLCSLFQSLKLKYKPSSVFTSVSTQEMNTLANTLQEIEDGIDPMACNRLKLPGFPNLDEFFSHCYQMRHYNFCVKKCGSNDHHTCKTPCLPGEVFETLHFISDPITTEKDRPSLN